MLPIYCSQFMPMIAVIMAVQAAFLVAFSEARPRDGLDSRLVECIALGYGAKTGLQRRFGLTRDMIDYHIFQKIDLRTPGAIFRTRFHA